MKNTPTVETNTVQLPPDLDRAVQAASEITGKSYEYLVRHAVEEFLDGETLSEMKLESEES